MSWKEKILGQIAINIQTGPFGSQLHRSDYSETGTPVVMPKDLIGGKISEDSIARVAEDHVKRLSRHKIEIGDILYSRRGDVGRCAFASEHEKGWLCGTGCLKVTIDKNQANPRFIFASIILTLFSNSACNLSASLFFDALSTIIISNFTSAVC